jgi:hypothetical protein
MGVKHEIVRKPPPRPLTDLAAVVEHYYARGIRDRVVDFTEESPTYRQAVIRACMSRDAQGKMHNHQSRVPAKVQKALALVLIRRYKAVIRLQSFDDLHELILANAPKGIGPVTAYDVAVRLGAWLRLEPEVVYLHAGVRAGWETLTGQRSNGKDILLRNELPPELAALPADHVEDILCGWREIFIENSITATVSEAP